MEEHSYEVSGFPYTFKTAYTLHPYSTAFLLRFQPLSCFGLLLWTSFFQSEVQSHYFRLNDLPTKTRPSASPRPRQVSRSNPRPISDSQLHALLHFHPCPIYLVVFKGSYFFRMGYLILRGASRLDAFSVYPFQTWLPGHRLGGLTGTPAVRPSRSSRTKDSSSQISYAHAG